VLGCDSDFLSPSVSGACSSAIHKHSHGVPPTSTKQLVRFNLITIGDVSSSFRFPLSQGIPLDKGTRFESPQTSVHPHFPFLFACVLVLPPFFFASNRHSLRHLAILGHFSVFFFHKLVPFLMFRFLDFLPLNPSTGLFLFAGFVHFGEQPFPFSRFRIPRRAPDDIYIFSLLCEIFLCSLPLPARGSGPLSLLFRCRSAPHSPSSVLVCRCVVDLYQRRITLH